MMANLCLPRPYMLPKTEFLNRKDIRIDSFKLNKKTLVKGPLEKLSTLNPS